MATNNNSFQDRIKAYLDKRAEEDSLFAVTYAKENKNISECCAYITSQAKKQASNGCAAISDDVVFGWAIHYYDEDNIKVEKIAVKTVVKSNDVNPKEEKASEPTMRVKKLKKHEENVNQLSLFEL